MTKKQKDFGTIPTNQTGRDMRYLIGYTGWRYGYLCGKVFMVDELTKEHMEKVRHFKTYQIFDTVEGKIFMPEVNEWKEVPQEPEEKEENLNSQ